MLDIQLNLQNILNHALMNNSRNLRVGQLFDATVTSVGLNTITLKVGEQKVTVQNNIPINLMSLMRNQQNPVLNLQVTKISPAVEFQLVAQQLVLKDFPPEQLKQLRFTVVPDTSVRKNAPTEKNQAEKVSETPQQVNAKIIATSAKTITVEIEHPVTQEKSQVEINRVQVSLPNAEKLKVGQTVVLEVSGKETTQIKLVANAPLLSNQHQGELFKTLFPRQQLPHVFLNQLQQFFPELLKDRHVSTDLKNAANRLLNHLPNVEKLANPTTLKSLVLNSGVFFESKTLFEQLAILENLPHASALQTKDVLEFKNDLTKLVQILNKETPNTTPAILNSIAKYVSAEKPTSSDVTNALKTLLTKENVSSEFKSVVNAFIEKVPQLEKSIDLNVLKTVFFSLPEIIENKTFNFVKNVPITENLEKLNVQNKNQISEEMDFKGNLLKFIHVLRQEISTSQYNATLNAMLNQLHTESENAIAGIVLNQLQNLPKEDSAKQAWIMDIPFLQNNELANLKLAIEQHYYQLFNENETTPAEMQNAWTVNLTLTPPNLGKIECVISYQNGLVNAVFANENAVTTNLVNQKLDNLKLQLETVGLSSGVLKAHDTIKNKNNVYQSSDNHFINETI